MSPSAALVVWIARRFLAPAAWVLIAGGLVAAWGLDFAPQAQRGPGLLSEEVSAGLARQGAWTCGLLVVLPWFVARAATSVRSWRRGEGDWLATSMLSRAQVAAAHLAGLGIALVFALAPFAASAEGRAGKLPALRWIADAPAPSVVLAKAEDRAAFALEVPRGAEVVRARFVLASPGDGGPSARVRGELERTGAPAVASEVQVGSAAVLELALPDGSGPASFRFQRVGTGAVVVLADQRVQWLARHPSLLATAGALFLHAWITVASAAAIALAVAAWTSPGSAFLLAAATVAGAVLAAAASTAWPGVGLRDALEVSAAGAGPGFPGALEWAGCACAHAAAVASIAGARDLWRREE